MSEKFWLWMLLGFTLSVLSETVILLLGLSRRHPLSRRLIAGIWLTACTYPFVWLVFPAFIDPIGKRTLYLAVVETFAPLAECLLFWCTFGQTEPRTQRNTLRDMATIIVANLTSFGIGLFLDY